MSGTKSLRKREKSGGESLRNQERRGKPRDSTHEKKEQSSRVVQSTGDSSENKKSKWFWEKTIVFISGENEKPLLSHNSSTIHVIMRAVSKKNSFLHFPYFLSIFSRWSLR